MYNRFLWCWFEFIFKINSTSLCILQEISDRFLWFRFEVVWNDWHLVHQLWWSWSLHFGRYRGICTACPIYIIDNSQNIHIYNITSLDIFFLNFNKYHITLLFYCYLTEKIYFYRLIFVGFFLR